MSLGKCNSMGAQDQSRDRGATAQSPLVFATPAEPSLALLQAGPNAAALAACEGLFAPESSSGDSVFLWGLAGVGKSFWAQAWAKAHSEAVWHWQAAAWPPLEATTALKLWREQQYPWLVVDDLHATPAPLQAALFALWVEGTALGGGRFRLLATASAPPALLMADFGLRRDLGTRLTQGLVYELRSLDDQESLLALRHEAHRLGWMARADDPQFDEVFAYLLARLPRQLAMLNALLEAIDRRALAEKRRVTVPLVRATLEALGPDGLSSAL